MRLLPWIRLRSVRRALACLTLLVALLADIRPATSNSDVAVGVAHRGPGAQARADMDRIQALLGAGDPGVVAEADVFLAELRARRESPEEPLEPDTVDTLAREAIAVRTAALVRVEPWREGFRGEFLGAVVEPATYFDWSMNVPASITVAQAILESNWGRSAPAHNLFGLKGAGPAGSTQRRVPEYRGGKRRVKVALFRAYNDVEESLLDHAEILATGRRYARARAASEDSGAYARALQGVYASDPGYARKLGGLIASHGLERFDWRCSGPSLP